MTKLYKNWYKINKDEIISFLEYIQYLTFESKSINISKVKELRLLYNNKPKYNKPKYNKNNIIIKNNNNTNSSDDEFLDDNTNSSDDEFSAEASSADQSNKFKTCETDSKNIFNKYISIATELKNYPSVHKLTVHKSIDLY